MIGNVLGNNQTTRRSVFVSYHHSGDQAYYDVLSRNMHDRLKLFTDNSVERRIDSSNPDYVMRRIREHHLHGSSCTLVLCGANTWKRKYVDWEIKSSLDQQMGLVGIWLPTLPLQANNGTSKPGRLQDNIDSGYAIWIEWGHIAADPRVLTDAIERSNSAPRKLICNSRERQLQNYY